MKRIDLRQEIPGALMLLFTQKPRVGWGETEFRRFFLSRFLIFAAARLHWPRAVSMQRLRDGKKISYIPFASTDDKLSQPLSCTSSLYFLTPASWVWAGVAKKKMLRKQLKKAMKINIWRASIKLVWRVCFICVFCSCRTNAGFFYALCKGTTFKKIFVCFRRAQGAM